MKQTYKVSVWPGCGCCLEVRVEPDSEIVIPESGLLDVEALKEYEKGDHPFTTAYDLRKFLVVYKNPEVFAWMEDGVAKYAMVADVPTVS